MSDVYITKSQLAGKKVELSDISIRDGLQSLETVIDTDTKVKYLFLMPRKCSSVC